LGTGQQQVKCKLAQACADWWLNYEQTIVQGLSIRKAAASCGVAKNIIFKWRPGTALSPIATVSLEPEAVKVEFMINLIGSREQYYELPEEDPKFARRFRVKVDFAESFLSSAESCCASSIFDETSIRQIFSNNTELVDNCEMLLPFMLDIHHGKWPQPLRKFDSPSQIEGRQTLTGIGFAKATAHNRGKRPTQLPRKCVL
jgi:hypothetical protein